MIGASVSARKVVLLSRLWADTSESAKSWASLGVVVMVVMVVVVAVADRASSLVDVRVGIQVDGVRRAVVAMVVLVDVALAELVENGSGPLSVDG